MTSSTNSTNTSAATLPTFKWSLDHYSLIPEIFLIIYCIAFTSIIINRQIKSYRIYKALKEEKGP